MEKVRVRFAPSPTGGLHLGGVRTVLYNYLFARKHGGTFVLRIEDTDQTRFVSGAEDYIMKCLEWCGLIPDESPENEGAYGPYRQSERKPIYKKYALQLIQQGNAYYAFDTPQELEAMRHEFKTENNPSPQYDSHVRNKMKNSLTLTADETNNLLENGVPYVIRIKMPENEDVYFNDLIRGEVHFNTGQSDDKVLLKADGMPTYHLAVVVDDYLMKITHVFRGEEWLPSAPAHLLLWKYLGWEQNMPEWAHLPLILKPDGHGKLSKRDGDLLGFPVFAMNWTDPKTGDKTSGFREIGFLPEAFLNMLAALGWNSGTEKEIYSLDELIQEFSIERVHKGGAKFDFEKAKWYNHEWIKRSSTERLMPVIQNIFKEKGIHADEQMLTKVIPLTKERCTLVTDFIHQCGFFFERPVNFDIESFSAKWNADKKHFFENLCNNFSELQEWNAVSIEEVFKNLSTTFNIKPGELQLPLRVMLVGGKFGPPVFEIAALLGKKESISRIQLVIHELK